MTKPHPVEKSPPYHVVIWVIAGLVAAAVVFVRVRPANEPPAEAPPRRVVSEEPTDATDLPKIPFTDITRVAGISFVQYGGATGEKMLPESGGSGCAFFDFDNDGDPDLLFISGRSWEWNEPDDGAPRKNVLALYRNDGDGKFVDVTAVAGLMGDFYGQGVAVGDFDADGDDDLVITAVGGIHIYRNDAGKFTDTTSESGLVVDPSDWPTSAGFFDYDRDGDLDLFVCNYVRWTREVDQQATRRVPGAGLSYAHPESFDGTQNYLFRNDGGRFSDVSAEAGIQVSDLATGKPLGKALAVTFVDFDRDGWLDVFVANDTVPHFLFRNRGNGTFEEVAKERGCAVNAEGVTTSGMSADAAWIRNDDALAIAVGNFAEERTSFFLSANDGEQVFFTDQSISVGIGGPTRDMLTWGLLFDDFDLDGRVDVAQANGHLEETIHLVQPNQTYAQRGQLFWNTGLEGPQTFVQLPAADTGDLAKPIVGRALASADIDGDGDLDLAVSGVGGSPMLLRNDQESRHHWLRVRLIGPAGNPHGVGATVELRAGGVTQRRTVMPTRSYLAQTEPIVTFGLGSALQIEDLTVIWPDGSQQTVTVEGVDRVVTVRKDIQTFAVLANIGKAQLENGDDYQKAANTLERALELKPDSIATRRNLARARFLGNQYPQALDELRRLEADSRTPSAANAYLMGLVAGRLADKQELPWDEAVRHLRRSAEINPREATVWYQLGLALLAIGDREGAHEAFEKTVELNPLHGSAQYQLASLLRMANPRGYDRALFQRLIADYTRVRDSQGGKIEPMTLEVCRYTNAEPPEAELTTPETVEIPASRFVADDVALEAAEIGAEAPANLAAVAPLFLEDDGHYQLVGVTPTGELVLIAFNDAGSAKVIARSDQPIGAVGNNAILLVGNTRRELATQPLAAGPAAGERELGGGTRRTNEGAEFEGDRPEIAIVTPERTWLFRYLKNRGFVDLTADSGLSAAAGEFARWVDLDHDGDIDLLVSSPAGLQVWQNNGDGTFAERTADYGLNAAGPTDDMAAADLEGWNSGVDLVLAGPDGTSLWRTRLAGTLVRDAGADASWPIARRVFFDDFNNDGLPDIVLVAPDSVTLMNGGGGEPQRFPIEFDAIHAATAIDVDNDGRLDLAVFGRTGDERKAAVLRNTGGRFADAAEPLELPALPRRGGLLALDIDADCDTDLLMLDEMGRLHSLRNETPTTNRQLKVSLHDYSKHPSSIGTRVEARRDKFVAARWTDRELPIEIGVGQRPWIDSVQTLWMNGLARNQIGVQVDCEPLRIIVIEFIHTDSCPFLYAWMDGAWQFVTDLLGTAPLNVAVARGVRMPPDPDEVVVLGPAERFADGGAAARLRITSELREVTYLDQVRLLAIDHPAGTTIFSRDRVEMTGVDGKQIIAGRDPIAVRSAVGSDGIDRTAALARDDGVFAPPGRVISSPVVGFIEPLTIEFEFERPGDTDDLFLAMTGWYRFGDSSSNIAASQRGDLAVIWPKLEVQTADGQWQLVDDAVGFPAGKTKTIVCDLRGKLPPQRGGSSPTPLKFRLTSSFEVRWDRFALYHVVPADEIRISEVAPVTADLRWHGFAEMGSPSEDQPQAPNLSRISDRPPWFTAVEGWCTRYGDIRPLLASAERQSAILNSGDGATIVFPAAGLAPREAATARTLALYTYGWIKAGDPNGTMALEVVPFPGSDAPGGDWQLEFNTRWVPRDRFAPHRPRP